MDTVHLDTARSQAGELAQLIMQHLVPAYGEKTTDGNSQGPAQRSGEIEMDANTTGDNAASRLSRTRTISYWCGAQPFCGGTRVATRTGLAVSSRTVHFHISTESRKGQFKYLWPGAGSGSALACV